jgi:hypothetical protein
VFQWLGNTLNSMGKIKKKIFLKISGSRSQKVDFCEILRFFRNYFKYSLSHTHFLANIYTSLERTV